jgi:hypothetical protein
MALGKTITYTPFQETSFAYGSGEIAAAHSTEFPNATDIVKVVITVTKDSPYHWDEDSGHISTPSSGTATAVYNSLQSEWVVRGERDDVDTVLASLKFFPADYPQARPYDAEDNTQGWEVTALKDNQSTGNYADEEPPLIPDTIMTLTVYDSDDTQVSSNIINWDPTNALFDNQRPYWSTVPAAQDLNSVAHGTPAGGLVDLGTISHGTDTENVQVLCEFRRYNGSVYVTGPGYGSFTQDDNFFIGGKKPGERNTTTKRFDFTGSVSEAQAFLDNVRYSRTNNKTTFDMFLTITDGVVGSTLTKTCYFSDARVELEEDLPDVHYVEDANPAYWDLNPKFTLLSLSTMTEVTSFKAEITLDSTGQSGTSNINTIWDIGITSESYSSGVYTIVTNSAENLQTALRLLRYYPNADFNSAFTFTVDFTFENTTIGSSHTSVQQSVSVTSQEVEEVTGLTSTHTWVEDRRYDFETYPQIIHGYNHEFDILFTLSDADAGILLRHGNSGFYRSFGTGAYKLSGTRDEVNAALENLYFQPNPDYDDDFTITFTVDRTSGDLTYSTTSNGTFTMTATALGDFTFPLTSPEVNWENNVSTRFASGLIITDTATDQATAPAFGSFYKVEARVRHNGSAFAHGALSTDFDTDLDSITGKYSDTLIFTGTKSAVNVVLSELKFIPDPLFEELDEFYVDYRVTRVFDNAVLEGLDFSPSVRTIFKNPVITRATSRQPGGFIPLFDWTEDEVFGFDSELEILEKITENSDYTAANGYTEYYNTEYTVNIRCKYWTGSTADAFEGVYFYHLSKLGATQSGLGWVNNNLVIKGTKAEINDALSKMRMKPSEPDIRGSDATNGTFWIEARIQRDIDSSNLINYSPKMCEFNEAADATEYLTAWDDTQYIEDLQNQYIFGHIEEFILDGSGDLFDVTYDVTVRLANETTGRFEQYVAEGYLEDTELSIFVDDFSVRITGGKTAVNEAIRNLQFRPFADVYSPVDIHYTQKRTFNNTTVTQADDVVVTTMTGVNTPDYVVGTFYGNTQFFVQDEFLTGLDLTGDYAISTTTNNREVHPDILAKLPETRVTLTPKQIYLNAGFTDYEQPIKITDVFEDGGESLYKVVFDGGSLFSPKNESLTSLGASLNITDTGWQTKESLNDLLKDGVYVTGVSQANGNVPRHGSYYNVTFTVYRKAATGVEAELEGPRVIKYYFTSGLQAWSYDDTFYYTGASPTRARIDPITGQDYRMDAPTEFGLFVNNPFRVFFRQSNGDDRTRELYGRIKDLRTGVWSDYHPTSDYQELTISLGQTGGNANLKITQENESKIDSNTGSYFNIVHRSFVTQGLHGKVEFFVWTKAGTFLELGSLDEFEQFRISPNNA